MNRLSNHTRAAIIFLFSATLAVTSLSLVAFAGLKAAAVAIFLSLVFGLGSFVSFEVTLMGLLWAAPLFGLLDNLLGVRGASTYFPLFWSALAVHSFRGFWKRAELGSDFPRSVSWVFFGYLLSFALSVWAVHPFNGLSAVVSDAPWGKLTAKHALGWIALSLVSSAAGPFVLFWLLTSLRKIPLRWIIYSMLGGLLVPCFLALLQYLHLTSLGLVHVFVVSGTPQYNGTFADPNSMGLAAALALPFVIAARYDRGPMIWRWPLVGATLFMVFISGSRSALIISAVSVVLFITNKGRFRRRIVAYVAVGFVLLAGVFLCRKSAPALAESRALIEIQKVVNILKGQASPNSIVGDRKKLWRAGWVTFKENPILGVGLGSYLFRMPRYRNEIGDVFNDTCANQYLQIAAEQGLVGLILFLLVIGTALWEYLKSPDGKESVYADAAGAAVVGLVVSFLFGAHLTGNVVNMLFWIFMGILFSVGMQRNEHTE